MAGFGSRRPAPAPSAATPEGALPPVVAISGVVRRADRTSGIPDHVENRLHLVLDDAVEVFEDKLRNDHRIAVEPSGGRIPLSCNVPAIDADERDYDGDRRRDADAPEQLLPAIK